MSIEDQIIKILNEKKPESDKIEYKAVLPPARNIARLISSFANTDGGFIILGVSDSDGIEINGLSQDFHANAVTHKAVDLLVPKPNVNYQYVSYNDKKLYVIKVDKSENQIYLEGKVYKRVNSRSILSNPLEVNFKENGYPRIREINLELEGSKNNSTSSMIKLIEHYQSVLKILDDLEVILYPISPIKPTDNQEGKILSRILYSSFVDNFETYLSDLLYEIYLANPSTLKSIQVVTIEEVLNCSDLQDFVKYWAKQKISKLQKGSVKGFIKDNKQIRDLEIIDNITQREIEFLLQIRHLYSHRNGIIDEKFLKYYTEDLTLNNEYKMSISEICDKLCYLFRVTKKIDVKAILMYLLSKE
tara:strand:- start:40844 stop:41923 length:1080 start_codon:yes stop_codon:yes gene_type:complete